MLFLPRAQETFTTTGTGALTVGGAPTGWQTLAAALLATYGLSGSVSRVCYYAVNEDETIWEFGYGTFNTATGELTRTLIASSTGSLISWAAGVKYLFSTPEAVLLTNHLVNFRGATAPAHARAGYKWLDTTAGATDVRFKVYDGADWITVGSINETANTFTPYYGSAALSAAVPLLASANVFTADQEIKSTDAGAGEGPSLILTRESASPAASDLLAALTWKMKDSAGNTDAVLKILGEIVDATSTSEDVRMLFQSIIAGTLATRMTLQNGLFMAGATGGDQGAGTINATNFYKNGVALGAGISVALVRDEKSDTTDGGGGVATTWTTRTINTEVYDPDGIVSISSNQFTLGAGKYLIKWRSPFGESNKAVRTRLYNVTDTTSVLVGTGVQTAGSSSANQENFWSEGWAYVDIAGSKAFAIQYYMAATSTGRDLGDASGVGVGNEVYTEVLIMKIG